MIVATVQDLSDRYEILSDALDDAFGKEVVTRYHHAVPGPLECLYGFSVRPSDDSSFSVRLADGQKCLVLDGTPAQNGRAVMAILKALPDVDPIMVADPGGGEFVIVTPDLTADDVATQRGWRPISEIDLSVWG